MKLTSLLVAASALRCISPAEAAEGPPLPDFLRAIRQVETGDRYDAPNGPNGEVGPYQFRRQVWHRYTRAPLTAAHSEFADEVAARHFAWIKNRLEQSGVRPTSWNMAAAWNGGVTAVCSRRVPRTARDYANRVHNLVQEQVDLREAVRLRESLTPHYVISANR